MKKNNSGFGKIFSLYGERIYNFQNKFCNPPNLKATTDDEDLKRIRSLCKKNSGADYVMLFDLQNDNISKVDDCKFPFKDSINQKYFCRQIQIKNLVQFLNFVGFAYNIFDKHANSLFLTKDIVLLGHYSFPVAIDFNEEKKNYKWYLQKVYSISLNEKNQPMSHLNFYTEIDDCYIVPNREGEIESRLLKPKVNLPFITTNKNYNDYLRDETKAAFAELWGINKKEGKKTKFQILLEYHTKHFKENKKNKSNSEISKETGISIHTVLDFNKRIINDIELFLNYRCENVHKAIMVLTELGFNPVA